MFSGLVEGLAEVLALETARSGGRLELGRPALRPGAPPWRPEVGESVAVSGCCLTVARVGRGGRTAYDLSRETLGLTRFARLARGGRVNVERALRLVDRLGGHLVSGHVDGLGRLLCLEDEGDGGRRATFEAPPGFERWLVAKGSVSVDGVSLTVVAPRGRRFQVALVPETLRRTTLGAARAGESVHLEGDLFGKWAERLLAPQLRRPRRARS
jgi:riboflavin synthase